MSDPVEIEIVEPKNDPSLVYSTPELEIAIGEPAPEVDPEKEALRKQLAEQAAALERAAAAPTEAIASGLADLGRSLRTPVAQAPAPAQGEDFEAARKRFNEKFFEDPMAAFAEGLQMFKGSEDAQTVKRNLAYSKTILEADSEAKAFYVKHADEVEAQIATLPADVRANDPLAYRRALRIVQADHIDELVAARTQATSAPVAPAVVPKPANYSESPSIAAAPVRTKITIPQSKAAEIQAWADSYAIGFEDAVGRWRANGWLK
jgi:hypothetical protein